MNKRVCSAKTEQGFTLIEVMISIFVISIGIFGLMKLQTTAAIGNAQSMKMTEGAIALSEEIETILGDSFDNYTPGDPVSLNAGDNDQYTITYTVIEVPVEETSSTYKQIHIETSWTYAGKNKSIQTEIIKLDM